MKDVTMMRCHNRKCGLLCDVKSMHKYKKFYFCSKMCHATWQLQKKGMSLKKFSLIGYHESK